MTSYVDDGERDPSYVRKDKFAVLQKMEKNWWKWLYNAENKNKKCSAEEQILWKIESVLV